MTYALASPPDQLRERFLALRTPEEISDLLEVSYRDFNYWIYRTPAAKRYESFEIKKKSGTPRVIDAPTRNIKILQQKLNQIFQSVYRPKYCVHGFVPDRSVRTNAERHVGRRYVFYIDLKDFFPSINFGRVRGMFMGKPYGLPENVSTVLAHLCCHDRRIPQGAPTSPIVSNMLCAQMDSQLQRLAAANRCTYTRYADDMTFSTFRRTFPASIAVLNDLDQVRPGSALSEIIDGNGFSIHPEKFWLRQPNRRQRVTGVTVNEFPNLPRKFTNQIRAMLHAWEKFGIDAAQSDFEAKYDFKHRAPWRDLPSLEDVVKGKIEYLGMVKGKGASTYLRFLDRLGRLAPELTSGRGTPQELLLRRYDAATASGDPHGRGYLLQDLLNETFKLFAILVRKSFTRNIGAEQIDGAFELSGWYYLVECRSRKALTNQRDLDGLLGQVMRSGGQTMGVFLSINGWSENVPKLLKQNATKRIFLMDGLDLRAVLARKLTLEELLRAKIEELNLKAEPFIGVDDILSKKNA